MNLTPLRVFAIGRVSGSCFVILRQDWETYTNGGQPIWVREGRKTFLNLQIAQRYMRATTNMTTDTRVAGFITPAKPYSIVEGSKKFADLAPAHEYLVRD